MQILISYKQHDKIGTTNQYGAVNKKVGHQTYKEKYQKKHYTYPILLKQDRVTTDPTSRLTVKHCKAKL